MKAIDGFMRGTQICYCVLLCIHPHHIHQLGDLESKANSNSVVGTLDWPDPALVALE